MRPAAILFDLDETIISAHGRQGEAWAELLAEFADAFGDHGHPAVHGAIVATARDFWADAERHRVARQDIRGARREIVRLALVPLGLDDPVLHRTLGDAFSDRREAAAHVFPGAVETLEELRARAIPLALVTNGAGPVQRAKIDRFDLARHFDHILIEGEFGRGKPEPEVFHHLMAALGTGPDETWVVGDNLEWEVAAPQRLGMHAIWCDAHRQGLPEDSPVRPDRIIHALPELLEELDGQP